MNKNTFLAIALSMLIMFGYDAIFVGPKRAQMQKNAQISVNTSVMEDSKSNPTTEREHEKIVTKTTLLPKVTKDIELSNKKTQIFVQNVGATLHNFSVDRQHPMPVKDVLQFAKFEDADFEISRLDSDTTLAKAENSDWTVTKNIRLDSDRTIKVRLESAAKSKVSSLDTIKLFSLDFTGISTDKRNGMLDEFAYMVDKKIIRRGSAFKFNDKDSKEIKGNIKWVAFRDHFNAFILKPDFETKSLEIKYVTENRVDFYITPSDAALLKSEKVFTIYVGPQDIAYLNKNHKDISSAVAFSGQLFGLINTVSVWTYYLILAIQSLVKSWGLSIILISLIVYGVTFPLTKKGLETAKKMQALQPKLKAIQERFKNDQQKLNLEITELYKREKINPLSGCLPMLLQFPISFASYQVMWRAHYFQGQGFLWIKDLTMPDRLFTFPTEILLLGKDFNILPILMAIIMFFQQRASAKNMTVTDETQAMQQKMMLYFFPAFIGYIFYKFASGVSLYFIVFYLLSLIMQIRMNKSKV